MSNYSFRSWAPGIENPHYATRSIYWSVFNHETNTSTDFQFKHDALTYKKTLPHATVYFHWFDDAFARINVSVEPPETYGELCRRRAQELRDTYSHLRFWFSGGADSQSALNSFIDNNIHLDEIVLARYPDGINTTNPNHTTDRENAIAALPALERIKHKLTRTKITLIQANTNDLDEWFNGATDPEKISGFDSVDGNHNFTLDLGWALGTKLRDPVKLDFCDIFGGSKVKLWKNSNKWYFYFVDATLHDSFFSSRTEDFFISRTFPELYLKTVYILQKFHINSNSTDEFINTLHKRTLLSKIYNVALGRELVPDVVSFKWFFETYNPDIWDKHRLVGRYSEYFFRNVINSTEGQRWHRNYKKTMDAMIHDHAEDWNTDPFGNICPPEYARKGFLSKFYCLNDGKTYDSIEAGWVSS